MPNDKLPAAALALYMAGRWTLPDEKMSEMDQAELWENLRDALGLRPGHSTKAGVNDT